MKRLVVLAVAALASCSLQNREGPNATCTDLGGGASNACAEGIIATCKGSTVTYAACDDKGACESTWQTKGQFRCNQADPLPMLTVGGTSGSTTGSSGTSVTTTTGSTTTGSSATGTATGTSGGMGCDPSGPCPVATTPSQDVDWYTVDNVNAYFSDCSTVWSVPKAGGFPTTLATGLTACSYGNIEVDDSTLYFLENVGAASNISLVEVAKTGGALQRPVNGHLQALASDALNLYWVDGFNLVTTPKLGGATQTMASNITFATARFATHGGFVYWGESDSIARVPTVGPFPTSPATLPTGDGPYDFAVTDDAVYFTVGAASGIVGRLPLAGGMWTTVASSQPYPKQIAVDGAWVYWAATGAKGGAEIRKTNLTGGSPALVATAKYVSLGRIVVDSTHVYWTQSNTLMRAPK